MEKAVVFAVLFLCQNSVNCLFYNSLNKKYTINN